ncbi:DnaJ domain-containing protein [Arenimonas sp.]|uniref:DnaJ domain-containing protein n=1 Tax=Arenimonas sp. TaxID=1872635 RepID=UPI0039E387C9
MISVAPPALHHALLLLRTPTAVRPGPQERLPEGMLLLLRVVAGDELALAEARQRSDESAEVVREAAAFYIQQVMFASGSHSYRLLGVDADAPDERIKEHYRWLVRWLHPDRNADEWEVVYADRVNRAWQDLRTPERRQRFDDARAADAANTSASDMRSHTTGERPVSPVRHSPAAVATFEDSAAGYNALRWLPKLIFGGLGVCAVLALGLLWLLRAPPPETATQAMATTEAAVPSQPSQAPAKSPDPADQEATGNQSAPLPPQEIPSEPGAESVASATSSMPNEPAPSPVLTPTSSPPAKAAVPIAAPAKPAASVVLAARAPESAAIAPTARRQPAAATVPSRDARRPVTTTPSAIVATATAAEPSSVQVAPRSEAADAASGLPTIDDRIANRLVGQLSQAYGDGDLQRMRSLVTSNAIGGSGGLLDEYDRLFASSEQRSLSISNVSWLQDGDNATIIATYVATVQARAGKRARRTGGDMRLDLRVEGGQWRIYRLSHDGRRG